MFVLTLSLFGLGISAQEKSIMDGLAQQLHIQTENRPKLSAYLQTSKGVYETGEDLWFKGYVLDAQGLYPSSSNQILYVQLEREDDDQVVFEEKYEIENGFVDGHLHIHDSIQQGDYRLTARSSHSFNGGSDEFHAFRRLKLLTNITDKKDEINNDSSTSPISGKEPASISFNLFPEGGYLVSGLESRIAFKAIDEVDNPVNVSGTLFEDNDPILDFKSVHSGMGSFTFSPNTGKKYHIQLNDPLKLDSLRYILPEILHSGIVMRLQSKNDDSLVFKVTQTKGAPPQRIYLRTQTRGMVQHMATSVLTDSLFIKLPVKDVPQGIVEITLFNKNLIPKAERLVYLGDQKKLHIKTERLKDAYTTRGKVSLKLTTTNENGTPVPAHLGISVFDKLYRNKDDPKNILNHYYLSTQLKGKIDGPEYYFDETEPNRAANLDLLLLTQGWRRYVWNEQNLRTRNTSENPLFKDVLEGKLTYIKKGKNTLEQTVVLVYDPLDEDHKLFAQLDNDGGFKLERDHLKLGRRLFVKHYGTSNDKVNLYVNDPFTAFNDSRRQMDYSYPTSGIVENDDDQSNIEVWQSIPEGINLDEVVVKSKKKYVVRDKYLSKLDSLARLEMTTDYVCKFNILNCIEHPNDKNNFKPVEGGIYLELLVWTGSQFERGLLPTDGTGFINPPLPPYHYPKITDAFLMSKFNILRTEGYYGKREFYNVTYDGETINDPFPDYRNTLFWSSDIITDKNGEAIIEFYCSDINSGFMGTIEGVTGDGLLGATNFEFLVRK